MCNKMSETSNYSNADETISGEEADGIVTDDEESKETKEFTEENNPALFTIKKNKHYDISAAIKRLELYPRLKIRKEGKYYIKKNDDIREDHRPPKKNKRGIVIPTVKIEKIGPIDHLVSKFCEDVICISRSPFLPLTSQGERTFIWVGRKTANHIITRLKGNGCYLVNRFPGDIFLKDKQVIGAIMKDYMLVRSNYCHLKCGEPREDPLKLLPPQDESELSMTSKICRHMVKAMEIDETGCDSEKCLNFEKPACKHLDVFLPEIQSFCSYNALQDFANRLDDDLKDQKFLCKPAYLYKGLGQRIIRHADEFKEFYHMTEGKETSRHDFMVQRVVDNPRLHEDKKFDIRAFILVVVLRYRRVVAFVHYGFGRTACMEYDDDDGEEGEEEDAEEKEENPAKQAAERALKEKIQFEADMRRTVCTWQTKEEKLDRDKRMKTGEFYEGEKDRSVKLEDIFSDEEELQNIKDQIKHIATRLVMALENKVWENYGCYQIFGMDLCVNEKNKVWLLEVNSHPLSIVDTLSTTQRELVPGIMMEAMGLVMETTYKSYHDLRLRKSPEDEFLETGFLFRQNYDFIFSTLKKKRMDYVPPPPKKTPDLPFYERIKIVDQQMREVVRRKEACVKMKLAVKEEQAAIKRKREGKDEEES